MNARFLRVLTVIALLQFFVTRQAAGRTVEEGAAERLWLLYPLNVVLNALLWTLVLSVAARARSAFRRT